MSEAKPPTLAFHGTTRMFRRFNRKVCSGVFYFTPDLEYAKCRARLRPGAPRVITAEILCGIVFEAPRRKLEQAAVADLLNIPETGFFLDGIGLPKSYFWRFLRRNPKGIGDELRALGYDTITLQEGHMTTDRPTFPVLVLLNADQIKILSSDPL